MTGMQIWHVEWAEGKKGQSTSDRFTMADTLGFADALAFVKRAYPKREIYSLSKVP